jgi:HK97 family phage prohead protease
MDNLEVRYTRVETDGGRKLRGTAIVYNALSQDLGGFREIISPSAADRTLKSGEEVHAYFNHDSGKVLGNTRAGTLFLRSGRRGLEVEIEPPSWAKDILESVERGDIRGMSFGFRTKPDWVEWDYDQPVPVRTVHDMEFSEISIVAKPAYRQTDIAVALRSMREAVALRGTRRDERALRLRLS